jgi:hypothetical protein
MLGSYDVSYYTIKGTAASCHVMTFLQPQPLRKETLGRVSSILECLGEIAKCILSTVTD